MVRHAPSPVNYARWVGGGYWKVEFCCDQEKAHQGDRKGSISTCVCFLPDRVQLWRICAVFFIFPPGWFVWRGSYALLSYSFFLWYLYLGIYRWSLFGLVSLR